MFKPLLLGTLLLTGCADPYWVRDMPGYEPKEISVFRLSDSQALSLKCRMPRTEDAACSFRLTETCLVYLGPKADECARTHELKHCRGWNHNGAQVYRQDCG